MTRPTKGRRVALRDDAAGRQIPWDDARCPSRGPALGHMPDNLPVGHCLHCGAMVIVRIDLEAVYTKPVILDDVLTTYRGWARGHQAKEARAASSRRPLMTRAHKHAAYRLHRAMAAEEFDPLPSDLPA